MAEFRNKMKDNKILKHQVKGMYNFVLLILTALRQKLSWFFHVMFQKLYTN